jgi:heme exporter protein D
MKLQFSSLADFLLMGGHAGFVFGAWGLSALVIALLIGRAVVQGRKQKQRLANLERDRELGTQ